MHQIRTCGTMDGAIHTAAAEQGGVGGIHNDIHV